MRRLIDLIETAQHSPPTETFHEVYHVGEMDPQHKQNDSLEGEGLSVSLHPEEWERIAELGGNTWWVLRKPGNLFLDYHEMTDEDRHAMMAWGLEHGWVEKRTVYRAWAYDSEREEPYYSTHLDHAEAAYEIEDMADEDDETYRVEEVPEHLIGTQKLQQRCRQSNIDLNPLQLLATIWADDVLNLDGVWWHDDMDGYFSAPRGVIFLSRLPEWQKEQINAA